MTRRTNPDNILQSKAQRSERVAGFPRDREDASSAGSASAAGIGEVHPGARGVMASGVAADIGLSGCWAGMSEKQEWDRVSTPLVPMGTGAFFILPKGGTPMLTKTVCPRCCRRSIGFFAAPQQIQGPESVCPFGIRSSFYGKVKIGGPSGGLSAA